MKMGLWRWGNGFWNFGGSDGDRAIVRWGGDGMEIDG